MASLATSKPSLTCTKRPDNMPYLSKSARWHNYSPASVANRQHSGRTRPQSEILRPDSALATGGVAAALLRLHDPARRPHLLTPSGFRMYGKPADQRNDVAVIPSGCSTTQGFG